MLQDHLTSHHTRSWIPTKAHRSPPSQRDLEIYRRVRIWGQFQWEVAVDFKITYPRVSQIVKRVERWLAAGGSPTNPQLRDELAQQKLSHSLKKMHLLRAVELASAALHEESKPAVKTRRRLEHQVEVWRVETTTEAPHIDLRALSCYIKAVKALQDFEEKERAQRCGRSPDPQLPTPDLLPALFELLCRLRFQAESAGKVQQTSDIQALITETLQTLLGADLLTESQVIDPCALGRAKAALNLSADSQTPETPNQVQPPTSDLSTSPPFNETRKT